MRTLDYIAFMTIDIVIYAGVPVLVMWLVGRFIGRRTAIVIGFLMMAAVVFLIVALHRTCSAPPICPDGIMDEVACHFPCDAPYAGILGNFVRYSGPISVALILAAILLQYWQFRRQRQF